MKKTDILSLLRYVAVAFLGIFGGYQVAPVAPPPFEGRCVQVAVPVAPVAMPADATVTQ